MPRTASDLYTLESTFALERTWNTKFGFNPDVDASAEMIWFGGGAYTGWLTTAAPLRVRAGGNANDTAAGSGARSVTLFCLDDAGDEFSETLALAGASASAATATAASRINRAWIEDCGTVDGSSAGNVLIETTGGTLVASLEAGKNHTQIASYCVPRGCVVYVYEVHLYVADQSAVDFRFYQRQGSRTVAAPFPPRRIINNYAGVIGSVDVEYHPPRRFTELTDLYLEVEGGSIAEVSAEFGFEQFRLTA